MNPFVNSRWIWGNDNAQTDEYCEFLDSFNFSGRGAKLYISADSNYAVYVNGSLAASLQYADFPYDKVYDEIDITDYVRQGKNVLAIRVWYYGIGTTHTYYPGDAGLIYSLYADEVLLCYSSSKTLSRISPAYISHKNKIITRQLGLGFTYDAGKADGWLLGEPSEEYPFCPSVEANVWLDLRPRTCLRTEFGETLEGVPVTAVGVKPSVEGGMIFDLGKEGVGFICLSFESAGTEPVTVAFGEHLEDGHVRWQVGGRDFSFTYTPTVGQNYYMNPFRRFGCRYVEIIPSGTAPSNVKVSLRMVVYPLTVLPAPSALSDIQRRIYECCVYTMQCCMHEHYEDCPWREQALYTMDSRNQMLTGYYAFGEYLFPRANLELIAADNRADGFLSICYPMINEKAIPSFSLHFITACEEYLRYSGDAEFIKKIYPKIKSVLDAFLTRMKDGALISPIAGKGMWNFYEWQPELDGVEQLSRGMTEENLEPDIILNTLLSYALRRMANIEAALGIENDRDSLIEKINNAINEHFYNDERGVYLNRRSRKTACKLGNALTILCGAAEGERARSIAKKLTEDELTDASLSMQCFVYDALIEVDKEKYTPYIIDTIEKTYTPMVEYGNGTVWETEQGQADFDNAGSLCHGWSAIPVYYYHTLLGDNKDE